MPRIRPLPGKGLSGKGRRGHKEKAKIPEGLEDKFSYNDLAAMCINSKQAVVIAKKLKIPVKLAQRLATIKLREVSEKLHEKLSYKLCMKIYRNPELANRIEAKLKIPAPLVLKLVDDRVVFEQMVENRRRRLLKKEITNRIPKHLQEGYERAVNVLAQAAKDHKTLESKEAGKAEKRIIDILNKHIPEKKGDGEGAIWEMIATPYYSR